MVLAQSCAPTKSTPCGSGFAMPSFFASGGAVRPYTITVAVITRNVMLTKCADRPNPPSISLSPNTEATDAATIPRGAIHERKSFSFRLSPLLIVERNTESGLAAKNSTPRKIAHL